jgi:3-phytase/alkaline phosphatase D
MVSPDTVRFAQFNASLNRSNAGELITDLSTSDFDTADFADTTPGNPRADYVLPSQNLEITDAQVFWPTSDDPQFGLVGDFPFPSSDRRLVWVDLETEPAADPNRQTIAGVDFLGEVTFPTSLTFENTRVGGLSGLAYDAVNDIYYSIADDRSQFNPARFYTLSIDLSDRELQDGDIRFEDVTTLLDESGEPFAELSLDPEGIALASDGTVYITSEGDATRLISPFVNQFSLDGEQIGELAIADRYLPAADNSSGIRNNLAFESATITPDGRYLYTATENALNQDGTATDLEQESVSRIIKYDLLTGQPVQEFVYEVAAVAETPVPADAFRTNGLVELLAIDNSGTLLALERSFSTGVGNTVKLYEISTQGALDVSSRDSLLFEDGVAFEVDPTVSKRELLDFADLGITPDNLEGLALGPKLTDGRQSLVVVSDNNFADTQVTQFIALGLDLNTIPVVAPTIETPPTFDIEEPPSGPALSSADDPAIYVHPTDSSLSLVVTALKNGGLQVHDLNGELLQTIAPDSPEDLRYNNVDTLYGFNLGGETVDLAIASDRLNDTIAIYRIDPTTRQLTNITAPTILKTLFGVDDGEQTAYGLANYLSPITGKAYTFVTQADGNQIAQLELIDHGEGQVDAKIVRVLTVPIPADEEREALTEGAVVDAELGYLYIGQEDVGIYKFSAEPEGGDEGVLIDAVKPEGNALEADVEGLALYYGANGTGYLIASSQGDSTFAVYSREGDNAYLGSFIVGEANGIDSVDGSDGLDVINVPLGPNFLSGLLVVHDQQNEPALIVEDDGELVNTSGNFKFVPWKNVASSFPDPLDIDTSSYDPRNPTARTLVGGTPNAETLVGTADDEVLNGFGGNDTIAGGLGNDIIYGGAGNDVLRGDRNQSSTGSNTGGDDILYGGTGNDRIGGKGGNDKLYGEAGNDLLFGDNGDDLLRGGLDNDRLVGGRGSDTFVLAAGGTDAIRDFQVGEDRIGLPEGLTFGQLSLIQSGQNTRILFSDETLAILRQVNASTLTEAAFSVI